MSFLVYIFRKLYLQRTIGTCIQLQIQVMELGNKKPPEAVSKHTGRLKKVGSTEITAEGGKQIAFYSLTVVSCINIILLKSARLQDKGKHHNALRSEQ